MFVLAHLGHWYAEIFYLGPVLVVVAWISVSNLREKRRLRREGPERSDGSGQAGEGATPPAGA